MRAASRFLLPLEMLIGLYTLLWGLSGGGLLGRGSLYYSLKMADDNFTWGFALGGVGAAVVLVALVEWLFGRVKVRRAPSRDGGYSSGPFWWISIVEARRAAWWTVREELVRLDDRLRRTLDSNHGVYLLSSVRCTLAFLMMGIWVGAFVVLFTTPALEHVSLLYASAVVHVVFAWWSYHENLKVRYALDEKRQTSNLQFYR